MTLAEFLTARLDEDEAAAQAASLPSPHWRRSDRIIESADAEGNGLHDGMMIYDEGGHNEAEADHIARHDPARVLREVEAKRKLIAEAEDRCADDVSHYAHVRILTALAAVYNDHPDYRQDWA